MTKKLFINRAARTIELEGNISLLHAISRELLSDENFTCIDEDGSGLFEEKACLLFTKKEDKDITYKIEFDFGESLKLNQILNMDEAIIKKEIEERVMLLKSEILRKSKTLIIELNI